MEKQGFITRLIDMESELINKRIFVKKEKNDSIKLNNPIQTAYFDGCLNTYSEILSSIRRDFQFHKLLTEWKSL